MPGILEGFLYGGGSLTDGLGVSSDALQPPATVTNGAQNQTGSDILQLNIGNALQGPNWTKFLNAIAAGDDYVSAVNQYLFDQAFLATASFPYLVDRASDYGLSYPYNLGISDDDFRKFALTVTSSKIVLNSILSTLEVFYTDFATRASMTSGSYEPYNIQPGYQLNIVIDGTPIQVTFQSTDFVSVGNGLAEEVGAAINRYFVYNNCNANATVYTDPSTNYNYVRIFSGAIGLQGSVQITGGQAQDVLLFPQKLSINGSDTSIVWSVSYSPTISGNARYSFVSGSNPNPLYLLNIGDYVNIYPSYLTATGFSTNNQGNFKIVKVGVNYFEVYNPNMTAQTSVVSNTSTNTYSIINFYRPIKNTIYSNSSYATASLAQKSVLNIYMPAVSPIIQRQIPFGAYFETPNVLTVPSAKPAYTVATSATISAGGTATLTVSSTTGFVNGQYIYLGDYNQIIGDDLYGPITVTSGHIAFPYTGTVSAGTYTLTGSPAVGVATLARNYAGVLRAYIPSGISNVTVGHPVRLDGFINPPAQNVSGSMLSTSGKINQSLVQVSSVNTSNSTLTINTSRSFNLNTVGPFSYSSYYTQSSSPLGSLGSAAAWTVALVINYNSSDTVDNAVYLTQNTGKWRIQSFGSYLSATFNGGSLIVTNNFNPGLNLLIFGQDSSNNAYLQLNNGPLATGSSYGFSAGGSPVLLGAYIGPNFPSYSQIVEVYGSTSAASASYFSSLYKAYSGNLALGSNYLLNKDSNTIGQWNAVDLFNSTARVGPVWTQLGTVPLNQISTTNNSTFSYSGGIITLYDAPLKTGIPGPYVYDTNTDNANISATITNIQTTISQTLNKGFKYNIVQVANPFQFPNSPGYVVFNFGQPNQLSLVPYVGSFTNQTGSGGFIILSPNYVFPIDVPSGSSVIYQGASSGFFVPNQPTLMSSTYLTDTPAGLAAAQDAVYDISAGGLGLIFNIMYGNSYGLGNWQYPSQNYYKITDAVRVNAENIEESVYDAQNPENFELIQSPT